MKIILLVSTLLLLTACSTDPQSAQSETPTPTLSISEQKEALYSQVDMGTPHYLKEVERAEPVWAGISHSSPSGFINTNYFTELTDLEDLQFIVEHMIEGSTRQPGIVAMSPPFYDMSIEYADGSTEDFFLWIEDKLIGTVMDSLDTHYIYTFPDDVSETFLSFIPEEEVISTPKKADWIDGDTFGLKIITEASIEDDINNLITYSDYIVQGTYLNDEPSDVPASWGDESTAFFTFEVQDVLKGDLEQTTIEVGQTQYITWWIEDPETKVDLGLLKLDNPLVSKPVVGKEVLLFISMQYQDGEFWRFSEPTMVEVLNDGTLRSTAPAFDPDFDESDRIEHHEFSEGRKLELTIEIMSDEFPLEDLFEEMTLEELTEKIY